MNRFSRIAILAAVTAVLLGAGWAFAQGPGGGGFRGRGPGMGGPAAGLPLGALDLTEAQREQVRQLMQQHREQTRGLQERVRAAMTARRAAADGGQVDPDRIRAATRELADVQGELAVQQAQLQSSIQNLLTAEQKERLTTLRAEREASIKERQGQMQERMQERRQRRQQAPAAQP